MKVSSYPEHVDERQRRVVIGLLVGVLVVAAVLVLNPWHLHDALGQALELEEAVRSDAKLGARHTGDARTPTGRDEHVRGLPALAR